MNRWFVLILLTLFMPGTVLAQAAAQRPTVGIEEIEDPAGTGQSATFGTMIESAISQSGRFRLIERSRLNVILAEQNRAARGGPVAPAKGDRVGGISGIDYLIYGSITSVGYQNVSDVGTSFVMTLLGGNRNGANNCQQKVATVSLDLKITDKRSGEVIYTRKVDYQQKSETSCSGEGSINIPGLLRGAADLVAANLVRAIYPIAVAMVDPDGSLLLNYGEGVLAANQYLMAYQKGQAIPDPTTPGRMIVNRRPVGLVRVTEVTSDSSRGAFAGGGPGPITPGQVLEPLDAKVAQQKIKDYRDANRQRR